MPTYVALLRGINLGSKRRVAMADLRELLEGLGYDDVRTHLQSGNVVLGADRVRGRREEGVSRQRSRRTAASTSTSSCAPRRSWTR